MNYESPLGADLYKFERLTGSHTQNGRKYKLLKLNELYDSSACCVFGTTVAFLNVPAKWKGTERNGERTMRQHVLRQPVIELVSAENNAPAVSMKRGDDELSGRVRFDNVPPGRYLIRLGQSYCDHSSGVVLSEVEVSAGATTEVFLRFA